jgi:hypothetical protein
MDKESEILLLSYFVNEASEKNMPTARSGGIFWWRITEEAWQKFRKEYGLCPSGHLFSLNRMTCTKCGESDLFEVVDNHQWSKGG